MKQLKEILLNYRNILLSIAIYILIILYCNLHVYLFFSPQGIHLARQTDSFSFVLHYLSSDSNFFHPGNLNLESINASCAGEFPIIYYLCFILCKIFGTNIIYLKLITLISSFFGFYFTTKLLKLIINSEFLVYVLSALFYSSTVLLYYVTLTLPEPISLSLAILGFYYYFKFRINPSLKLMYLFYLILTFSALLKASFYYYLFIVFILIFVSKIEFKFRIKFNFLLVFISSLIVFFWYFYARSYNSLNLDFYYTVKTKPIWETSKEKVAAALSAISNYWYSKYYFQSAFHTYFFSVTFFLIFIRKSRFEIFLLSLLVFFSLVYIALFLSQFIDHDYYFIVLIPSFIIIVSISINGVYNKLKFKFLKLSVLLTLLIITMLSIDYARLNIYRRYNTFYDNNSIVRYQLLHIKEHLPNLNNRSNKKYLVIGDMTRNASLYFLNEFGWTYPNFNSNKESLFLNLEKADYLVVLSPSKNKPDLEIDARLKKCMKYTYLANYIYDLKDY